MVILLVMMLQSLILQHLVISAQGFLPWDKESAKIFQHLLGGYLGQIMSQSPGTQVLPQVCTPWFWSTQVPQFKDALEVGTVLGERERE